jgi:hypothetical protein
MSAADGTVLGLTKIFDAGSPATRWNLVIVADGYTAARMGQFAADAAALRDHFLSEPPFDRPEIQCGVNFYRLDVVSNEAGADKPDCADGGGAGTTAATYFDSSFCFDGNTQRLLYGDSQLVRDTVGALLPQWHQIFVLVDDPERGGGGGDVAWQSNSSSDWRDVALHELGHAAFNLADEYSDLPDAHDGTEPQRPNVTAEANPAACKWSSLVTAGPAAPTRANPDCTTSDPGPSGAPAGTVGTFEGGSRIHCGLYRPEWTCMMRTTGSGFCAVCTATILDVLAPFTVAAPGGDVTLATGIVDFNDVPTGLTVVRAARFMVDNCFDQTIQALTVPAAPFALESPAVHPLVRSGPAPWPGYFWFRFTAGAAPGSVPAQVVTLRCLETGEDFDVTLTANVIERPSVATQLVFDQSGSMLSFTDEGRTKEQVLKDAATVFADLLWDDNGVGINAYDHDAHAIMPVTEAGAPGVGGGRDQAIAAIAAHASNPAGWTAVGDGIEMARADLDAAGAAWDVKAMIVLTDGIETASKTVAEVADSVIDNRVFAIGMGTAEQIMPATLDALTSATGGYLLMTGHLSVDETFLLEKYYLQILAGVNNNDVVLDPEGTARIGAVERIPFDITEADVEFSAIVLARPANILRMGLEAPDGTTIGFGNASVIGRVAPRSTYMRAGLPLMEAGRPHHAGRWHLLLTIDRKYWQRVASENESGVLSIDGVRYSASVTAYSGLRMMASVHQSGREPGATLRVRSVLTEYGAPFQGSANVVAWTRRPDGFEFVLPLAPVHGEPGAFEASTLAASPGITHFRIVATGRMRNEQRFTREALRTGAVWHGGDLPNGGQPGVVGPGGPGGRPGGGRPGGNGGSGDGWPAGGDGTTDWCELLRCLFGPGTIDDRMVKRLAGMGLHVERLRACLERLCRQRSCRGEDEPATATVPQDAATLRDLRHVLALLGDRLG